MLRRRSSETLELPGASVIALAQRQLKAGLERRGRVVAQDAGALLVRELRRLHHVLDCESAPNIDPHTDAKSIKHLGCRSASGPHAGQQSGTDMSPSTNLQCWLAHIGFQMQLPFLMRIWPRPEAMRPSR
jgi:hypothetical protein